MPYSCNRGRWAVGCCGHWAATIPFWNDPEDINGNLGSDIIAGQEGNDTLRGGQGLDTLLGGLGNDELYGNRGEDIIDGGDGSDLKAKTCPNPVSNRYKFVPTQ